MREWLLRRSPALLLVTGVSVITLTVYLLNRVKNSSSEPDPNVPRYSYDSFQDASRSIRLLYIPNRKPEQESSTRLHHRYQLHIVPIESAPAFEAISYTWGSGPHNESIYIQNPGCSDVKSAPSYRRLHVSAKVKHILHSRVITHRKGDRWVWIDSVCINQQNTAEKDLQVPLMGDIYGRAAKVIICLDDPLEKSPLQFQRVIDLLELWSKHRSSPSARDTDALVGPRYAWRKLAQLLSHPYWARVWIIQEAALPKHLYILAEGKVLAWETFVSLWSSVSWGPGDWYVRSMLALAGFSSLEMDKMSLSTRQINDVMELRAFHQSANGDSSSTQPAADHAMFMAKALQKLLYDSRRFSCSVMRDKVYGLLGLLGTSEDLHRSLPSDILPKYKAPTEQVYISVANWFCSSGLYANQLVRSGIGYPRSLQNLPSWVPDWTSLPVVYLEETIFSAGGTDDRPVFNVERSQDCKARMRVKEAHRVGVLAETLPHPLTMAANGPTTFALAAIALVERHLLDHFASFVSPESEESSCPQDDTLWRSLLMDCDYGVSGFFSPAPCNLGEAFVKFYEAAKVDPLFHRRAYGMSTAKKFLATLSNSNERTFGVTEGSGMAMVPPLSRAGDEFFVIRGVRVPVLLRRVDMEPQSEAGTARYQLVGDAYLHGMMQGEALLHPSSELVLV